MAAYRDESLGVRYAVEYLTLSDSAIAHAWFDQPTDFLGFRRAAHFSTLDRGADTSSAFHQPSAEIADSCRSCTHKIPLFKGFLFIFLRNRREIDDRIDVFLSAYVAGLDRLILAAILGRQSRNI